MNVILIVADTWRRDHMGCYGNSWVRTPHLDELAKRAAVFDNAWCGSFGTMPNRNEVITGRYEFPWRGPCSPTPADRTLPGLLARGGKKSFLVTDTHYHWAPGACTYWWDFSGFELIRGQNRDNWICDTDIKPKYPAPEYKESQSITQHLRAVRSRSREEDWFSAQVFLRATHWFHHNRQLSDSFLMVDAFDPHEPWDPPRKYSRLFEEGDYEGNEYVYPSSRPVEGYMTPDELRHVKSLYAGETALVDRWMGHLLKQVRTHGGFDNTLVIITSDHGVLLGEHGLMGKEGVLYQPLARIPLIIWHPTLAHPRRFHQLVQPVDILPTVLDAAGLPIPDGLHGRSLLPLLADESGKIPWRRGALFGRHGQWCNLTDGRFVLHRNLADNSTLLFDTDRDPLEVDDLSTADPKNLHRMSTLLTEALREIQAPAELLTKLG